MGKKKQKNQQDNKTQIHPTLAFVQNVARNTMLHELSAAKSAMIQGARMELFKYLEDFNIEFQTLKVLLGKLWKGTEKEFEAIFEETRTDLEDERLDVAKTAEGAIRGDFVRFKLTARKHKDGKELDDWLDTPADHKVPSLLVQNPAGRYTLGKKEVEEQFLGLKAGESKEITDLARTNVKNDETGEMEAKEVTKHFKIEIVRVSRPSMPVAPEKEEGKDGKNNIEGQTDSTEKAVGKA